jgi:hypothetical protein
MRYAAIHGNGECMTETTEFGRAVEKLTLLLLYLTSWEEELAPGLPKVRRSWKTFRFEVLDVLAQQGYITTTHRAKSVGITEEGLEKARELQQKYLGS